VDRNPDPGTCGLGEDDVKGKAISAKKAFHKYYKDPEFVEASLLIKPYYDLIRALIRNRKKLGITKKKLAKFFEEYD
jgi:hypothetical protein